MSEEDESFAFQNFDTIFRQILQDLGVTRSVEAFKILADPDEPYFLVSLKLGRARNAIKVSDMAQLNEHTGDGHHHHRRELGPSAPHQAVAAIRPGPYRTAHPVRTVGAWGLGR